MPKNNGQAQLTAKIMSLERQISQLNNGKQTAKPKKRKAERRGPMSSDLTMGVYANEFSRAFKMPAVSTKMDGSSRITGREIISTIDITFATGIAPSVGVNNLIAMVGDVFKWLKAYGSLYDLYRFKSLKFTFQPTLSTVFSGNYVMYFDPGKDETSSTFVEASTNYGSVTSSIHQPSSVVVRSDVLNRLNWYQVSGGTDVAETRTVGNLFFITNSITGVSATTAGTVTAGYIWAEYDAEFKNPTDPDH